MPWKGFKAAAQAGVAQGAVAAAVAGKLVGHVAYLGNLLVDMGLPRVAKVGPGQLGSSHDGRERCDMQRSRG